MKHLVIISKNDFSKRIGFLRNDDEMFHLLQTLKNSKSLTKVILTKQNLPKKLLNLSVEISIEISIEISLAISFSF